MMMMIFPPHLSSLWWISPVPLPEFFPSLLSVHTCTASPSLAFPSFQCFSVHFPRLFSSPQSTLHPITSWGLFVGLSVQFVLFSSHPHVTVILLSCVFSPGPHVLPMLTLDLWIILRFCLTIVFIPFIGQLFVTGLASLNFFLTYYQLSLKLALCDESACSCVCIWFLFLHLWHCFLVVKH